MAGSPREALVECWATGVRDGREPMLGAGGALCHGYHRWQGAHARRWWSTAPRASQMAGSPREVLVERCAMGVGDGREPTQLESWEHLLFESAVFL